MLRHFDATLKCHSHGEIRPCVCEEQRQVLCVCWRCQSCSDKEKYRKLSHLILLSLACLWAAKNKQKETWLNFPPHITN